jgi:hypothetical protein
MRNPIENLGDYNKVRIDLQNANGSLEKLYKNIGDTAVAKAAPRLLLTGGAIAAGLYGIAQIGKKGIQFMKDRKEKIINEPALKEEFAKAVEYETVKGEGEGITDRALD